MKLTINLEQMNELGDLGIFKEMTLAEHLMQKDNREDIRLIEKSETEVWAFIPKTIGELIEWIRKNADKQGIHFGFTPEGKYCGWCASLALQGTLCESDELIDALFDLCIKIKENKVNDDTTACARQTRQDNE